MTKSYIKFFCYFVVMSFTPVSGAEDTEAEAQVQEPLREDADTDSDINLKDALSSTTLEGPKLKDAGKILPQIFSGTSKVDEVPFLPLEKGGLSFMGLVSRLFGTAPEKKFEGINTRRWLYLARDKKGELLGLAHGSYIIKSGVSTGELFFFYKPDGEIIASKAFGLPPAVQTELEKPTTLNQMVGLYPEDFEVKRGRRGRIKSHGKAFKSVKAAQGSAKPYWESVFRSARYNAAFMDVAWFVTQHPDLADKTNGIQGNVKLDLEEPTTGPEAHVAPITKGGDPRSGKPSARGL